MRFPILMAGFVVYGMAAPALAQAASDAPPSSTLDPVIVTAQRWRQTSFDAPAAVSAVTGETIQSAGAQVNLSESLNRVPGLRVLNRQNYAQDLQLSIRGFGARSTFGIRGVRVIVDGIPATMPDGQGQASNISLGSVGRIEVLRGPLAQMYGNAAAGVVQVFTEDDAAQPTATASVAAGPYDQSRIGMKFSARTPGYGLTVDASRYGTEGPRPHSSAQRGQLNARWQSDIAPDTHLSVVLNALDQPDTQDPLGLTRAQWEANPRQTTPQAITQDARKTVRQNQVGSVIEHRFTEATRLTGRLYLGERNLSNILSVPLSAQLADTSSGGAVQFDRVYAGFGAQLSHRAELGEGRALRVTAGLELDRMQENRQGYISDAGVTGVLKRDERNVVETRDAFAQASLDVSADWTATAGLRTSRVRFRSEDHFIAGGNPDDSGGVGYDAVNPVLGLSWRAAADLNLYANAGRGFETPTFTELAYRPVGTGFNTDLRAARSTHTEIGAKWKASAAQRIDLALFDIRTRNELAVDTNSGGRSTYKNVERTRRSGVELSHVAQWSGEWRSTLSVSVLRARFLDAFTSGSGAGASVVAAGNRLPGTPEHSAFAELAWAPRSAWNGFNAAVEVAHTGALFVDDANSDAAPAATVFNLRAGFAQRAGAWRFAQLLRVDNAGDRRYAGSVIVNEANGRYFEPAVPRSWLLALTAAHTF